MIVHHLRKQNDRERIKGLSVLLQTLPPSVVPIVETLIDEWWNLKAQDAEFWKRDCASVFDEVIADARRLVGPTGVEVNDDLLFDIFNIVTVNFAANASAQPEMRTFIGIRVNSFPLWSALALAYPLAAAVYVGRRFSDISALGAIGYGMCNLGYLLLAAGVTTGSFRILGLRGWGKTIAAAVAAWILGVLLTNAAL